MNTLVPPVIKRLASLPVGALIALSVAATSVYADLPPPSCEPGQITIQVDINQDGITDSTWCNEPESNFPGDVYEPPAVGEGGYYTGTPGYVPNENLERGVDSDGFDHGEQCDGNPVKIASGNKYHAETDFIGAGRLPLTIERYYNSLLAHLDIYKGAFGQGWSTNFLERIIAFDLSDPNDRSVLIETASGLRIALSSTNGGPWLRSNGKEVLFAYDETNDAFLWIDDGLRKSYLADGELYQIRHPSGETLTYVYSETETMSDGSLRLERLVHSSGRELQFDWDTSDRITTITDPAGLEYTYWYDSNGNLERVDYPIPGGQVGSSTYHYEYTTGDNRNALTGITYSPSSVKYANYVYDSSGRATRSEHFAGAERVDFEYTSSTAYQLSRKATNALGKETEYVFQLINERMRATSVDGIANGTCLAANKGYTYDAAGFYDTVTDWEGNVTKFGHNEFGQRTSVTTGFGTSEARTTEFEWHPLWNQPTLIDQPLLATVIDYDYGSGLVLSITQTNKSIHGSGYPPRITTFAYEFYADGTMKKMTIDGPRTDVLDVTAYHYDTSARLTSIVNALQHQTLFTNFDPYGRPQRVEYPSGLNRDFSYHPNGSVLSVSDQVGVEWRTTTYEYYENGDLKKSTGADGASIRYYYDYARRVDLVIDDNDRHLNIIYDAASNIERTEIWRDEYTWVQEPVDPNCDPYSPPFPECQMTGSFQWIDTLVRHSDYEYDALSRLEKAIQGNVEVDQYAYNKNDQLREAKDGFNRSTFVQYNPHGQADDTTFRDGGVSQVTYDANGHVSGIRDALGEWTYYQRDGFGQAWKIISPSTGTTDYEYDTAGNLIQKINARGITTTYGYDALNRVTSVQSGAMAADLFAYDTDRAGFLYHVDDDAGTHTYLRNVAGEVLSRTSEVNGVSLVTTYTYDSLGRIDTLTYPSGLNIKYHLDALGQVERIETWGTGLSIRDVVREVTHYPWGPVDDYEFGNGELRTSKRDRAYRISYLTSGNAIPTRINLYDSNSNIKQIGYGFRTFTYDEMDRLATHAGPDGSFEYDYDLNGNRIWHEKDGVLTNYVYSANGTRLMSRSGGISETRTYNALSNTRTIGAQEFVYNEKERISQYKYGGQVIADYAYNAFGERAVKTDGSISTYFVYDGPNLLHERTGSNTRDYIYLRGEIVGVVINSALYYVHNDHLGRPEALSNSSQQKVWEAENNAFGSAPVLDAINGFNIGFPGQYYDSESGTWYNYYRTYDPSTGRYLESDPIGLAGGLNTYGYVAANPLRYTDPYGLDLQDHRNRNIGIAGGCAAGAAAGALACVASGPAYPFCEAGVIVCACAGGSILGGLAGIWADTAESTSDGGSSDSPRPDVSGNPGSPDPDEDGDKNPGPGGIPDDWSTSPSKKGGGTVYTNPANKYDTVRVMPGNPRSPNPAQQRPYVVRMKDGQAYDKNGNVAAPNTPQAHIPLDEFVFF